MSLTSAKVGGWQQTGCCLLTQGFHCFKQFFPFISEDKEVKPEAYQMFIVLLGDNIRKWLDSSGSLSTAAAESFRWAVWEKTDTWRTRDVETLHGFYVSQDWLRLVVQINILYMLHVQLLSLLSTRELLCFPSSPKHLWIYYDILQDCRSLHLIYRKLR